MEEKCYIFPGQTVGDTKIADQGHVLIANPVAWMKINENLAKAQKKSDVVNEELARRKYLKDTSYSMAKHWDNSIAKIEERRIKARDIKVKNREENLVNRFLELRADQEEERVKIVAEAKKRMSMVTQDARKLNSALLLTEVLYERRKQQEFDAEELQKKKIEDANFADLVTYNAMQEKKEDEEKLRRRKETHANYIRALTAQMKQIESDNKKEKEERLNNEAEDNRNAEEEFKAIKEYTFLLEKNKKAEVKEQFHKFAEEQKEFKENEKSLEETLNKISKIHARAKYRIDEMKKYKAKQFQEEKTRIKDKIAAEVMEQQRINEEEVNRVMLNAQRDYEEKYQERKMKKERYQQRLRVDLIETRRQYLKKEQEEQIRKKEISKWDMATRMKNNEATATYNQNKAQGLFDEKILYREQLNQQIKEDDRAAYEQRCKDQQCAFFKQKLENDDKSFFAYADEVLDLVKSRGRSTDQIERVVHNYKVENNLEPKKKNISHLKSKVPIDSTGRRLIPRG